MGSDRGFVISGSGAFELEQHLPDTSEIQDTGFGIRDLKRASRISHPEARISHPELRVAPVSLVPPVSRRYPAAEPVQNRAERPMPTLVFLMELGSKFSLRLERCTSTIP